MECKNCGSVLEEGQIVCHCCGEAVKEKKPKKPWTKKRIAKLVIAIVAGLLVLSLIAGILVLALRKNDVYYKGRYTVADFWSGMAKNQVVATMGDYKLTNGQLQVFYWMQIYDVLDYYAEQYGDYATYFMGIDLEMPFSEQIYNEETGMTWEQYFLKEALYTWNCYQALCDEAKKANFQMPEEYQKQLSEMRAALEASAKSMGKESVDTMIQADLGSTVTYEDYYYYLETCWLGDLYLADLISKVEFTEAEMDAFYEKNKESMEYYDVYQDGSLLVDFRNILVKPVATKDENGKSVITDEAWETCRQKAQEIIDSLKNKELTEEAFAEMAKSKSEDKNSASYGGLNQYISKNSLATVDVRHILIMPKGGQKDDNGNTTYSEDEWEACRESAQALLDRYLAGEKTEEAFGALANEHSEDQNGKVTNGGLYSDVYVGKMVKPFEQWIFDGSRKPGDTDIVKTQYGYHVMYFVERKGAMDDWLFTEGRAAGDMDMVKTEDGYQILYYVGDVIKWEAWCREGLMTETSQSMRESCANTHPVDVRYWAVTLSKLPEAQNK